MRQVPRQRRRCRDAGDAQTARRAQTRSCRDRRATRENHTLAGRRSRLRRRSRVTPGCARRARGRGQPFTQRTNLRQLRSIGWVYQVVGDALVQRKFERAPPGRRRAGFRESDSDRRAPRPDPGSPPTAPARGVSKVLRRCEPMAPNPADSNHRVHAFNGSQYNNVSFFRSAGFVRHLRKRRGADGGQLLGHQFDGFEIGATRHGRE